MEVFRQQFAEIWRRTNTLAISSCHSKNNSFWNWKNVFTLQFLPHCAPSDLNLYWLKTKTADRRITNHTINFLLLLFPRKDSLVSVRPLKRESSWWRILIGRTDYFVIIESWIFYDVVFHRKKKNKSNQNKAEISLWNLHSIKIIENGYKISRIPRCTYKIVQLQQL